MKARSWPPPGKEVGAPVKPSRRFTWCAISAGRRHRAPGRGRLRRRGRRAPQVAPASKSVSVGGWPAGAATLHAIHVHAPAAPCAGRRRMNYEEVTRCHPRHCIGRVLLKISGEALMGDRQYGIDPEHRFDRIAGEDVAQVHRAWAIAGLPGGRRRQHLSRPSGRGGQRHGAHHRRLYGHAGHGDEFALAHAERAARIKGLQTRVQSAIPMADGVPSPISAAVPCSHMEKGRVVIFAAGSGNPYLHHRHHRRPQRRIRDGLQCAC